MTFIRPKYFHDADSMWDLKTEAFDLDNTPSGSFRANLNSLITPDIPRGVLGGMVAAQAGDWESTNGLYNMVPLGLYNKNSEGEPYTNNSAIASGKVAIYMHGGTFLVYLFETNNPGTPFAAKTFSTAYVPGSLVYCSPFSLLTSDLPTAFAGDGVNYAIGVVAKTPTVIDQEMGLKLVI
jgi:hypothetical protein